MASPRRLSEAPLEVHLRVSDPEASAVTLLALESELSRQTLRRTMDKGAVWLTRGKQTRRIRRRRTRLWAADILHLYYDARVLSEKPVPALQIDDQSAYSIWDKPAGMRSQGSRWGDHTTLMRWAEKHTLPARPAYTVHRLDRHASGLMLVAHDKSVAAALSQLFRQRRVKKRYRVIVHGHFSSEGGERVIDQALDGREARTRVGLVRYRSQDDCSILDVTIETGRKHQIRRHLVGLGFPVLGDRLYGAKGDRVDLQLRAVLLEFDCPLSGKKRSYRLPPSP